MLRPLRCPFRYLSGQMSELGSSNLFTLRPLPLSERRAVGGPVSRNLLATYVVVALACWVAATVAAIVAARDLAAGRPLASAPVLAVHLLALGVLPFAVSGASFHLLPVMLRNDLPSQRALWIALPLLAGGSAHCVGARAGRRTARLARRRDGHLWPGGRAVGAVDARRPRATGAPADRQSAGGHARRVRTSLRRSAWAG